MGRIIVSTALSIDGYASGAGGDISAMPLDQTFNRHNAAMVRRASSLLYGATTYRQMLSYWPNQLDNPDDDERYIAQRCADGIPITVVSDTLGPDDTGPWRGQTTIVRRAQATEAAGRLRSQDGDAVMFGSQTLWASLVADGLVDELHLLIGPKLVAGDRPAFAGSGESALTLLDVQRFDGSESVLLSYGVR